MYVYYTLYLHTKRMYISTHADLCDHVPYDYARQRACERVPAPAAGAASTSCAVDASDTGEIARTAFAHT